MNSEQMNTYLTQYLRALDCTILEQTPAYIRTQLSIEADKDIMGRPYYWMFVERTGAVAQPMELTFIVDPDNTPDDVRGEHIAFGCLRLHQIFASTKKRGQFVRLYEENDRSQSNNGLVPWLCLNYKMSFICDQSKDLFYPLGCNLMNGEIVSQFDQTMEERSLTSIMPDHQYKLPLVFTLRSAIDRVEKHIKTYLASQDTSWADEANKRLQEEQDLIQLFFNAENSQETLQAKLAEVDRYRPHIRVSLVNTGLIYLRNHPLQVN